MDLQHEKIDAIFMGLYNEHKERTRHDAFECNQFGITKHPCCGVCISLRRYKDAIDKERAAEHVSQEASE